VTGIDEQERRRLDYSQTTAHLRELADTRFKLVALLPTISGAAVALLSRHPSPGQLLAVGVLGLCATAGVVVYELRNSRLYDYALERAGRLERELGLGGLYGERPGRDRRLFGIQVAHDRGLALTHAAAAGGWVYLLAWGGLRLLGLEHSQRAGGVIAIVAAAGLLVELLRIGGRQAEARDAVPGSASPRPVG
jgi:hypothetical protein